MVLGPRFLGLATMFALSLRCRFSRIYLRPLISGSQLRGSPKEISFYLNVLRLEETAAKTAQGSRTPSPEIPNPKLQNRKPRDPEP